MAFTVHLDRSESVVVQTDETEARPPDAIRFFVAGRIENVGKELLSRFSGRTVRPTTLTFANGESVEVDLTGEAELELTGADAAVNLPDASGPSLGDGDDGNLGLADAVSPVVEFSVTGVVEGVEEATVSAVEGSSMRLSAVTFEDEDATATDGGANDAVLELELLGFSVRLVADGSLTVLSLS